MPRKKKQEPNQTLNPKPLSRLPVLVVQIKAENNSHNLKNKIR